MPVYRVERYLAEAIESIVRQSLGFESIQLILVNDGSPDGSGKICEGYAEKYPEQVVYIEQKNAGVSAARNTGLRHAKGQYVNFMDADDLWSENAFAEANAFFQAHQEIKIAAARMVYFDAELKPHLLNYKYEENEVIDLWHKPDAVQLSLCDLWMERKMLSGFYFDTGMPIGEDSLLINELLLREMRYGALKMPVYWYRKRPEESSAMDSRLMRPYFYRPILQCFHRRVFEISRELYSCVIPYAQYCIMYDLQWRLKRETIHPLSEDELKEYRADVISLLASIEDHVILSQRNLNHQQMLSVLALKRNIPGDELRQGLMICRDQVYLSEGERLTRLWAAKWERHITLEKLEVLENGILIEGRLFSTLPCDRIRVYFETDSGCVDAEIFERDDLARDSFFTKHDGHWLGYRGTVAAGKVRFHLVLNGHEEVPWSDEDSLLVVDGGWLMLDESVSYKGEIPENLSELIQTSLSDPDRLQSWREEYAALSGEEMYDRIIGLSAEDRIACILGILQQPVIKGRTVRRINKEKQDEIQGLKAQLAETKQQNQRLSEEKKLSSEKLKDAGETGEKLKKQVKKLEKACQGLDEVCMENERLKTGVLQAEVLAKQAQLISDENEKASASIKKMKEENRKLKKDGQQQAAKIEKLKNRIAQMKASSIYRTGRIITWIPRKLKKLIRHH